MRKKILTIVGTRPNFIKITQFRRVFGAQQDRFDFRLLHTGQHWDAKMSDIFFQQLRIGDPEYHLGASLSHPAEQFGEIITRLVPVYREFAPDLVMVVGDVNSTLAAALTANKMGIRVAHVESGLRSFDRTMPEEHNRVLTDDLADLFLLTEESGRQNLLREGKPASAMHMVGNTMIDTLVAFEEDIQKSDVMERIGIGSRPFVLMTIHRPANVDEADALRKPHQLSAALAGKYDIVFPVHPRTRKNMETLGLAQDFAAIPQLLLTDPVDYLGFQKLIANASFILTDSGGIQEETTFRQVPCLTLRPNTERPVTVDEGTNTLVTFDVETLLGLISQIEAGTYKKGRIPHLWDGRASERIAAAVEEFLG